MELYQAMYILAAAGFILALMWMGHPATGRRGVFAGEIGMLLAVVGTLMRHEVVSYEWIIGGMLVGTAIGIPIALLMPMTAVPQRTALSHSFGGLAVGAVGTAEYYLRVVKPFGAPDGLNHFRMGVLA